MFILICFDLGQEKKLLWERIERCMWDKYE